MSSSSAEVPRSPYQAGVAGASGHQPLAEAVSTHWVTLGVSQYATQTVALAGWGSKQKATYRLLPFSACSALIFNKVQAPT